MIKPQYSNILFQFVHAIKSAFGDFQNYQTLTPSLYYTVLSKSPILMYAFYNETLVRFSFVTQACPISKKEEGYTSCRRYCMVDLFKSKPGRLCSLRHSPHVFCHVLSGNFCSFVCLFKGPHFYARIGVERSPMLWSPQFYLTQVHIECQRPCVACMAVTGIYVPPGLRSKSCMMTNVEATLHVHLRGAFYGICCMHACMHSDLQLLYLLF